MQLKAALFEVAKKLAYPTLDAYWFLKRSLWRACPVCASGKPFARVQGYGRTFLRCSECSHLWAHDYSRLRAALGMGMRGWGGEEPDTGGTTEESLARFCIDRLGYRSILLYGTGPTRAFRVLRQEGRDVYGCDVSKDVIAYRQAEFGADRYFHVRDASARKYDAVIATEVIEHLFDPMGAFREIMQLIAPEGIFCGSTGFSTNGEVDNDNGYGYMRPRNHIVYWSRESLGKAFAEFGWSVHALPMVSNVPTAHLFFATGNRGVSAILGEIERRGQRFVMTGRASDLDPPQAVQTLGSADRS